MKYSLFDYYRNSFLSLEEILKHYVDHSYLNKYGRNKVDKVLKKAIECDRMKELFGRSIQNRDFSNRTPDFNDFSIAIAKTFWFLTQSNETIVLATLAAAVEWNKTINSHYFIIGEEEFRNNILNVFRKFDIHEEMTEHDYRVMTDPYIYSIMASSSNTSSSIEAVNAKEKIRAEIINILKECDFLSNNFDPLFFEEMRESVIKLLYKNMNMLGSDTRRIADKYGIDIKALINEEIDKTI